MEFKSKIVSDIVLVNENVQPDDAIPVCLNDDMALNTLKIWSFQLVHAQGSQISDRLHRLW